MQRRVRRSATDLGREFCTTLRGSRAKEKQKTLRNRMEVYTMKTLHILWQRVVNSEGATCDRCQTTREAVEHVLPKLKQVLLPLAIEPVLETRVIDMETFKGKPSESNRIWIEGRPIEEWVGASVGESKCCSVCGDSNCRTLEVGGAAFEAIPEELILKAALIAVAQSAPLEATEKPDDDACCSTPSCCATQ